ncbi:unnamed protein product [Orchesella dallaii]|uniref:Uncharacterized protein n=1 Tax=Orchesella dallaii TaxID=48710 RepID=A0ABP1QY17_9HEXA
MNSSFSESPPDSPPEVEVDIPYPHTVGKSLGHHLQYQISHIPAPNQPNPDYGQVTTGAIGVVQYTTTNAQAFNPNESYLYPPLPNLNNEASAQRHGAPVVGGNTGYLEQLRGVNPQSFPPSYNHNGRSVPPATTCYNGVGCQPPYPLHGYAANASGGHDPFQGPQAVGYHSGLEYGYHNGPPWIPPRSQQPIQHDDPEGGEPCHDRSNEYQGTLEGFKVYNTSTNWNLEEKVVNGEPPFESTRWEESTVTQVVPPNRDLSEVPDCPKNIQTAGAYPMNNFKETHHQFHQGNGDYRNSHYDKDSNNNLSERYYELMANAVKHLKANANGWPRSYEADDRIQKSTRKVRAHSSNLVHWKPSPDTAGLRNSGADSLTAVQSLNSQGFTFSPSPLQHHQGDHDHRGMYTANASAPPPIPKPPHQIVEGMATNLQIKLRHKQESLKDADESWDYNQPDLSELGPHTDDPPTTWQKQECGNKRMRGDGVQEVSQSTPAPQSPTSTTLDDSDLAFREDPLRNGYGQEMEMESRNNSLYATTLDSIWEESCFNGITRSGGTPPPSNMNNLGDNKVEYSACLETCGKRFGNMVYQDGIGVARRDQNGNILHDDIDIEDGGGNSLGESLDGGGGVMQQGDVEVEGITMSDTDDDNDDDARL